MTLVATPVTAHLAGKGGSAEAADGAERGDAFLSEARAAAASALRKQKALKERRAQSKRRLETGTKSLRAIGEDDQQSGKRRGTRTNPNPVNSSAVTSPTLDARTDT